MRWSMFAPVVVVAAAVAGMLWWTGGGSTIERQRSLLATAGPTATAEQRALLQQIAASKDPTLLPEVTRGWERTFAKEGFQQRDFRPNSPAPEFHAVFIALGPAAAEQLVAWSKEKGRFVPCLLAAGVALGGESSAEVGSGPMSGGAQVRAWRFAVRGKQLPVPTTIDADWYGQLEVHRQWEDAVAVAQGR